MFRRGRRVVLRCVQEPETRRKPDIDSDVCRAAVSVPFDDLAADVYGRIRADLERQGQAIGPNDTLIAAIALANGLTIVTHNTAEFSRVSGLLIEDWHT